MNINEVFRRLNDGVVAAKDHINQEPDMGKRIQWTGFVNGLETAMKVINEVNHSACDEGQPLRRCNGWGKNSGICTNKVQRQFLVLFCPECNRERLANSDRPVYGSRAGENYDIIPFPGN